MKIPFDIKFKPQIESGEYKVETRDGRPVRIVCYDIKYGYPIVALATEADGHEIYVNCDFDGRASHIYEWPADLFIVTPEEEPKLSAFEEAVGSEIFDPPFNEEQIKVIKEESAKLFELAKEDLQEKVIHDYWKQAADRCVQAREEGKAEALRGLPMWIDDGLPMGSAAVDISGLCGFDFIRRRGRLFRISDLEKLPGLTIK